MSVVIAHTYRETTTSQFTSSVHIGKPLLPFSYFLKKVVSIMCWDVVIFCLPPFGFLSLLLLLFFDLYASTIIVNFDQ